MTQEQLFPELWTLAHRQDQRIRRLADRHYSRQSIGNEQFAPPGRGIFLITSDDLAAWVVVENLDGGGNLRWRCTIFRNEGTTLSSTLIMAATTKTRAFWPLRYGYSPTSPLTTEVDATKTRRKRDPGRCFRRAGWTVTGETSKGLIILTAPS